MVVIVEDESRLAVPFAIHDQTLIVAPGRRIGITQAIDHGEQRAVFPRHAAVRPQVSLVPVGELAFHSLHGDFHRLQAR